MDLSKMDSLKLQKEQELEETGRKGKLTLYIPPLKRVKGKYGM
jgi:hypothetical protein